jgi:methylamine utilization protein MauE
MSSAVREVQIPLLAALLLLACAGKALRAVRARSITEGLGPTVVFPLRLRRPAAMLMCATELFLGIALLVTAGRVLPWPPATAVRLAVVLLFLTATGALVELRAHHPDAGCGCFGELSSTPVGNRAIARSALFTIAAAATVGMRQVPLTERGILPGAEHGTLQARLLVLLILAEIALISMLSPELGEALVRLGYREPCELRLVPQERTLARLRGSRAWRSHARLLTATAPADSWRELCWRYAVFPGEVNGRAADVVFAVHTRRFRPPVRAVVVDSGTGEVISRAGRTLPSPSAAPDHAPGPLPGPGAVPAGPGTRAPAMAAVAVSGTGSLAAASGAARLPAEAAAHPADEAAPQPPGLAPGRTRAAARLPSGRRSRTGRRTSR